jgi:hypothetical protein
MNKKLILIFVVSSIAINTYSQQCINTAKQIDSLVEQLKLNLSVKLDEKTIYIREDHLYNWLNNFPIQLCKKLPLFENGKIQNYNRTQRQVEYFILLNFYRNTGDTIIRNYITAKLWHARYYEFFYRGPELSLRDTSNVPIKAMTDYTEKNIDTSVLKKILIANRNEKNKKLPDVDTISAENYKADSSAYWKQLFNSDEMDYFVMGTASDLKLLQFAPWLEENNVEKRYDNSWQYEVTRALARMRYKNYYAEVMKGYLKPSIYTDEGSYASEILYIECKECFDEWKNQLSDTTTKIVLVYETSERTYYDTVYLAKYISACLFTLFRVKDWNREYKWFFWPPFMGMEGISPGEKAEKLPYNRNKLQKFINEGYPFHVSRKYYKYIR